MRRSVLAVVLGCALAATVRGGETVLYPRNAGQAGAAAVTRSETGFRSLPLLVLALGAAAAGGWLLWRPRRAPAGLAARAARKLAVAETRSLGNRQYLVVADYDGKKFLLGVCPGRIDLLAPLEGGQPPPPVS